MEATRKRGQQDWRCDVLDLLHAVARRRFAVIAIIATAACLGLAILGAPGCVSEPIARELRFWGDHGVAAVTGDNPARD